MPPKRQIYLLDPQKLPAETIAVAFARTSRSPQSFQEIAKELTDEKSADFHEKWVVGYGHSSVAEHAILHIAVENISRLAVECLESNRLASYTEKSTRYQKWDPDAFCIPPELEGHPLESLYREAIHVQFETYQKSLPLVRQAVMAENPLKPGETESAWDRRLRTQYVDVCRFLLPAASLANVGMTINARALEHALNKMLSHPLAEVRAVGMEMKKVAQAEAPTLIKYADGSSYFDRVVPLLEENAAQIPAANPRQQDWCRLVSYEEQGEERVLAAALFRFGQFSFESALSYVHNLTTEKRAQLASQLLGGLERFDIPLREAEYCAYIFELVIDQGAFFELKRHRMMTQTVQDLNPYLGYALPLKIVQAGFEKEYTMSMETARQAYERIAAGLSHAASYVIPNAYNRRILMTCNLRSASHLVNLRAAENAHFSMRRAAQRMAELIQDATPLLGQFLRLPESETWQGIEKANFSQTR